MIILTASGNEYDGASGQYGYFYYIYNNSRRYSGFNSGVEGLFFAKISEEDSSICYYYNSTYCTVVGFDITLKSNSIDGQYAIYSCGGLKSALNENTVCDTDMNVSFLDGDLDETGATTLYAVWDYVGLTFKNIIIKGSPGDLYWGYNLSIYYKDETEGIHSSGGNYDFYLLEDSTKVYYRRNNGFYEVTELYVRWYGVEGFDELYQFVPDNSDYEDYYIQDGVLNIPAGDWLDEVSYFSPVLTETQAGLRKLLIRDTFTGLTPKAYYVDSQGSSVSGSVYEIFTYVGSTDTYTAHAISGVLYLLTKIECVREGFTFLGFYTAEVGGTKVIEPGGSSLLEPCDFDNNTTLYAQWEVPYCKINLTSVNTDLSVDKQFSLIYEKNSSLYYSAIHYYSSVYTVQTFIEYGSSTLLYYTGNVFYEVVKFSFTNDPAYLVFHGFYTEPYGEGIQMIDSGGNLLSPWTEEEEVTLYAYITGAKFEFYVDTKGGELSVTCEMGTFSSSDMMTLIVEYYSKTIWYPYVTDNGTEYYEVTAISCIPPTGYTYFGIHNSDSNVQSPSWVYGGNACLSNSFYEKTSVTAYVNYKVSEIRVYFRIMKKVIEYDSYSNTNDMGATVLIEYANFLNYSQGEAKSYTLSSASVGLAMSIFAEPTFTVTCVPEGYVFMGWSYNGFDSRGTEAPSLSATFEVAAVSNLEFCFYFSEVSANQLKYDETDKYYYFEDGYFPQSYVGDIANEWLTANASLTGESCTINGLELALANDITYSGTTDVLTKGSTYDFARLENSDGEYSWFLFEPIRWRVSDYGVTKTPAKWTMYASSDTEFNVVSDTVLWLSAFSDTSPSGVGYEVRDASINDIFEGMTFLNTDEFGKFLYMDKFVQCYDDKYNSEGTTEKVGKYWERYGSNYDACDTLRVASLTEIDENFSSFKAKASDLVATILGQSGYVNYWTRNLGQYYGNGNYVLKSGNKNNNGRYSNIMGVRFAMTMTEGSRY